MPTPIRFDDIEAVFAVTDSLGIHREAITIPMARVDPGDVRQPRPGQLVITIPESESAEAFAAGAMKAALADLGYEDLP